MDATPCGCRCACRPREADVLLSLLLAASADPGCTQLVSESQIDGPSTFAQPTAAAKVVVELRVSNTSSSDQVAATIDALNASGASLPVTVLLPSDWKPAQRDILAGPHIEVGLRTSIPELMDPAPINPAAVSIRDWQLAVRDARKELRAMAGANPRTVSLPPPPPGLELVLDDSGVHTILVEDPGAASPPRVATSWGGRPGRARLLTEQGYDDSCGATLRAPTTAALDRIARAGPTVQVLRVALTPDPALADVFVSWWATVAVPAGWEALRPRQAGLRFAGAWLPRPQGSLQEAPAPAPSRQVTASDLDAAAETIVAAGRLPRSLSGEMNLTEAFLALSAWAAEPQGIVAIGSAKGPDSLPGASMRPPGPVDTEALTKAAQTLVSAKGHTLPALVTVGADTLTAREYLVALAHLKLGRTPIARDTPDPDPYAPDGGWGSSGSE